MSTIDKLVLNLEKVKQELPKDAYETIILLSTIDAWSMGISFFYDYKSKFDSAVTRRAKTYALRYAKDESLIGLYESRIKDFLSDNSTQFNNYLKMNLLGVNPVFAEVIQMIKSRYGPILEQDAA